MRAMQLRCEGLFNISPRLARRRCPKHDTVVLEAEYTKPVVLAPGTLGSASRGLSLFFRFYRYEERLGTPTYSCNS